MTKIDRKLNLVIPVDTEAGEMYVYSAPILRATFEQYWGVMAQTHNKMYAGGTASFAGPRIALLALKQVAQAEGVWSGKGGVEEGLFAEIRRLTYVCFSGARGWEFLLLDDAVKEGKLDEDDQAEVENIIVFFTLSTWLLSRGVRDLVIRQAMRMFASSLTSLSITEFLSSLKTSTGRVTTGESQPKASPAPPAPPSTQRLLVPS